MRPAAGFGHPGQDRLGGVEGAVDVDVEHAPPRLERDIHELPATRDPRVVDQDRRRAELGTDPVDRRGDCDGIAHVRGRRDRCPATGVDLAGDGRATIGIAIEAADGCAVRREAQRRRPADPDAAPVTRATRPPNGPRSLMVALEACDMDRTIAVVQRHDQGDQPGEDDGVLEPAIRE